MGGLDLRAPTGLMLSGYGLYETLTGKKGGGHALAIGNGLMGSWLASVGVNAGRTLAEKKGQPQVQQVQQQPQAQPQVIVTQGMPQPHLLAGPSFIPEQTLQGPVREVLLTPEPTARGEDDSTEGRRRGGRGGGGRRGGRGGRMGQGGGQGMRRPNRFRQEESEEEDEA